MYLRMYIHTYVHTHLCILQQLLCAFRVSVPEHVFTQVQQVFSNVVIDREIASIHYAHGHARLEGEGVRGGGGGRGGERREGRRGEDMFQYKGS